MGLFDKKYCDICGSKIGLLGNRKLEDGNLCKECAAKLSPWFSERRQSSVEEIRGQLAYREENKQAVAAFHTTRTLGGRTKVLLDEDAGTFMVTSARNPADANPDVLRFSDVTGCQLDIDEGRSEIQYKDAEGKRQSFNPKCYAYSYDFYIVIHVNHPYFNEIRFQLNESSVDNGAETLLEAPSAMPGAAPRPGMQTAARPGMQTAARPSAQTAARPGMQITVRPGAQTAARPSAQTAARPGMQSAARPGVQTAARPGAQTAARPGAQTTVRPGMAGRPPMGRMPRVSNADEVRASVEYKQCEEMGIEIRDALLQVRTEARQAAEEANAPKAAVTCPWCGATTIPDDNGCCEYCGGAVNG